MNALLGVYAQILQFFAKNTNNNNMAKYFNSLPKILITIIWPNTSILCDLFWLFCLIYFFFFFHLPSKALLLLYVAVLSNKIFHETNNASLNQPYLMYLLWLSLLVEETWPSSVLSA